MIQGNWRVVGVLLIALLAGVLQCASVRSDGAEFVFRPEDGLRLRKSVSVSVKSESRITEMWPTHELLESAGVSLHTRKQALTIDDEYILFEDGRVKKLERRYGEVTQLDAYKDERGPGWPDWLDLLALDMGLGLGLDFARTSPLAGGKVLFSWDKKTGALIATSDDVSKEHLKGLKVGLDFSCLLPQGPVVVGAKWDIDAEALLNEADPWSDLPLQSTDDDDSSAEQEDWGEMPTVTSASKAYVGELVAQYKGRRTVDDVEFAVITVRGEVVKNATSEVSGDLGDDDNYARVQTITTFQIEGEALWDPMGNHLHSMELEAETTKVLTDERSTDGATYKLSLRTESGGTWELVGTFERT